MAEFELTASEMTSAAGKVKQYCQNFKETADQLKAATETLTTSADGWSAESSQIFNENIQEAHKWLTQMSELINQYAETIEQSRDLYVNGDEAAAKNFK